MKLNKHSKLVKFAYWMDTARWTGKYVTTTGEIVSDQQLWKRTDITLYSQEMSSIPARTSLCRFFWRAFLIVPLVSVPVVICYGVVAAGGLIGGLISGIPFPKTNLGVGKYLDKAADGISNVVGAVLDSVFIKGLKAIKARVCPIITFEDQ